MMKKIMFFVAVTVMVLAGGFGKINGVDDENAPIIAEASTEVSEEQTMEEKSSFEKEYTKEKYGIGGSQDAADVLDHVTKYSVKVEAETPYFIGREDATATQFLKKQEYDKVLYLGMPMHLSSAMKENVYFVSIDKEEIAKIEGNELVGLKQGTFTLTTYDKSGNKLEDIDYAVTTYNDSRNDIATALTFPEGVKDTWRWGITKELPYWKTACSTLMDVSFYFQARDYKYSAEGEPEINSLNGDPLDDWMYNNDVVTIFEANKGVCLQAAQLAAYLLADDFEDWGVVMVDGMQGHIFNWFYEDGLYYIMDYTSIISWNSWGRSWNCAEYQDFSNEVKVCKSIEEIVTYVQTEKVDINQNYLVYMYSLLGHDYLPCNINTAKYSSRDALAGKYEEIIVGFQDCIMEELVVLYNKKGINVKFQSFALEEMPSTLVHGRYFLDEEYHYYYDYK